MSIVRAELGTLGVHRRHDINYVLRCWTGASTQCVTLPGRLHVPKEAVEGFVVLTLFARVEEERGLRQQVDFQIASVTISITDVLKAVVSRTQSHVEMHDVGCDHSGASLILTPIYDHDADEPKPQKQLLCPQKWKTDFEQSAESLVKSTRMWYSANKAFLQNDRQFFAYTNLCLGRAPICVAAILPTLVTPMQACTQRSAFKSIESFFYYLYKVARTSDVCLQPRTALERDLDLLSEILLLPTRVPIYRPDLCRGCLRQHETKHTGTGDQPVMTVYDQWTRPSTFPSFHKAACDCEDFGAHVMQLVWLFRATPFHSRRLKHLQGLLLQYTPFLTIGTLMDKQQEVAHVYVLLLDTRYVTEQLLGSSRSPVSFLPTLLLEGTNTISARVVRKRTTTSGHVHTTESKKTLTALSDIVHMRLTDANPNIDVEDWSDIVRVFTPNDSLLDELYRRVDVLLTADYRPGGTQAEESQVLHLVCRNSDGKIGVPAVELFTADPYWKFSCSVLFKCPYGEFLQQHAILCVSSAPPTYAHVRLQGVLKPPFQMCMNKEVTDVVRFEIRRNEFDRLPGLQELILSALQSTRSPTAQLHASTRYVMPASLFEQDAASRVDQQQGELVQIFVSM